MHQIMELLTVVQVVVDLIDQLLVVMVDLVLL
jgi:hypothetical protein